MIRQTTPFGDNNEVVSFWDEKDIIIFPISEVKKIKIHFD